MKRKGAGIAKSFCFLLCGLGISLGWGCERSEGHGWLESDPAATVNQFPVTHSVTPTQQLLTPAGRQVELPGMRPQVLALSPDGKLVVTSGETNDLVAIDAATGAILQRLPLIGANGKPDPKADASYTGLVFSPDGTQIFLSNRVGNIEVYWVDGEHRLTNAGGFELPPTGVADEPVEVPMGLGVSGDGQRLYAALMVADRLLELDAATGKVLRAIDVENSPFDVVLVGKKAYVSNRGGRRVRTGDLAAPNGPAGTVLVDPVRFIADEGSVSVVDLDSGKTTCEILTGVQACGMAKSPDGRFIAVANANSDTISIIDCGSDRVVQTISARWDAGDLFGASPNALVWDTSGKRIYVCNGTQNAVGVIDFSEQGSRLSGLIPVGWFPGAIVCDGERKALYVANIKGVGSGRRIGRGEKVKFNSHEFYGTVSLVAEPDDATLAAMTRQVLENDRRRAALAAMKKPRINVAAMPVPLRVGEPSVFRHVVYIIKENRTYDQVLGDLRQGNGDEALCIYGKRVTPNQHKLASDFVLLDNTYCSGASSAEGHEWADSAFCTDYVERSYAANFPRCYPIGNSAKNIDAMTYAPSGFIWDNLVAHGKTLRDYGEFSISTSWWADRSNKVWPRFLDYYRDFLGGGGKMQIGSKPAIPSLRNYLDTQTVGWDLDIPDVLRAQRFIAELKEFEKAGTFPDMCIIWLPNDHTSATLAGAPTPEAQVADNDLALGKIVEAISHSVFWKDTCIFAIEDDTQDGWDHVNAFRTTAYVVSPYTRRHAVVHTNYAQPGLMHTMELILGLPPMNELDAQAPAMGDCFTKEPDFTPWSAVANEVPLDEMNPPAVSISDPVRRNFALASEKLPLAQPDQCPEDLLNRILWDASKGSKVAYPKKLAGNGGDDDR